MQETRVNGGLVSESVKVLVSVFVNGKKRLTIIDVDRMFDDMPRVLSPV
jgi:hypothetical protein